MQDDLCWQTLRLLAPYPELEIWRDVEISVISEKCTLDLATKYWR